LDPFARGATFAATFPLAETDHTTIAGSEWNALMFVSIVSTERQYQPQCEPQGSAP
jgi:hypothetical protein